MKLRIMNFDLSYVDIDVPDNFDLSMCGQSTKALGFFCNGQIYIPYEDIKSMFVFASEADIKLQRGRLN